MLANDVKRLKELENRRLKTMVADLSLDKEMLKELLGETSKDQIEKEIQLVCLSVDLGYLKEELVRLLVSLVLLKEPNLSYLILEE